MMGNISKWLLLTVGAVTLIAAVVLVGILLIKSDKPSADMSDKPASTTKVPTKDEPKAATGTTITSAESEYGNILWGPNRQAIYIWEREPSTTPQCYDDCATAWPPVLTTEEPSAGAGIDDTLLGTTERSDGTTQVTYNGHPLYYYAHEGPGEVKCHNVTTHGGLWWVITVDGARAA